MQNFFACQHRKQKFPTENSYDQTKNQQYCTRQQASRNKVLHATCSKTQTGFVFRIHTFFHKDFMLVFLSIRMDICKHSHHFIPSLWSLLRNFQQQRHLEALVSEQGNQPHFFPSVQGKETVRRIRHQVRLVHVFQPFSLSDHANSSCTYCHAKFQPQSILHVHNLTSNMDTTIHLK